MAELTHPIAVGTKVQYLSPRCPCSGSRFAVVNGLIKKYQKLSDGRYTYTIKGERKVIPQEGILKILS